MFKLVIYQMYKPDLFFFLSLISWLPSCNMYSHTSTRVGVLRPHVGSWQEHSLRRTLPAFFSIFRTFSRWLGIFAFLEVRACCRCFGSLGTAAVGPITSTALSFSPCLSSFSLGIVGKKLNVQKSCCDCFLPQRTKWQPMDLHKPNVWMA